ncbi:beta-ketoacyl synthase [Halodesulfovibrio spirochaetisodalis]|uniref:3-oxoacyl-[acyl-carrier-protein] synthase 1 n=2 Tax=Halodesulfovibrio spirochaetisodalis TaxID=1560234 RepID=A0A1B7XBU1_9BACT|nr:beta-ketoacyl synthase [Halodesulfovibrio spirochaetisodalis]
MHRVAVTGIGIVSCLGLDLDTVQESLKQGKSGIQVVKEREELGFFSPLSGVITDFDYAGCGLTRRQKKTMPNFTIQAYSAVTQALQTAGLTAEDIQNSRTGLIFGNDSTARAQVEQAAITEQDASTSGISSGYCFKAMTSTITLNLNVLLGVRGASWSISSACSSGGHAIGQAADLIALGRQDRVICGGAQEINWQSLCSFDALEAFSRRIDAPEKASRPFDAGRDGLVPSGGAAAVILERYDLAVERGATILGELEAYGFSSDGSDLCRPNGEGLQSAMEDALERAQLQPSDIDLVSAHATSTPVGDKAEAFAISNLFGDQGVNVTALKSMTGHELWMSGASQVVYTILQAQGGFTARTINFETSDEMSEKLRLVVESNTTAPGRVMLNSAGFGGTNACLILNTRGE